MNILITVLTIEKNASTLFNSFIFYCLLPVIVSLVLTMTSV